MIKYALIGLREYYVEILDEQFYQLKTARTHLFELLSIEEKLNLVLENYAEFEQELFNSSIKAMLFQNKDWSSGIDEIHVINRRIVNLLTTCRLYIDQIFHNICSIYGKNSEQEAVIERQTNLEYDDRTRSGYRVMEAIRNYVQHRGLPIDFVRHPNRSQGTSIKHTIEIGINIKTLAEDGKFKKAIINELKERGDIVKITPLVRQYLESIGRIHSKIRDLIKTDLLDWEENIHRAINEYQNVQGFSEGLNIVAIDESGNILENLPIFRGFIKRRQALESKNKYLTHYSSHFISNEASY